MLVEKISKQKGVTIDIAEIDGANYFFSGHLDEAVAAIKGYLDKPKEISEE